MNGTWIGTLLTLLGGGAMGAVIKIAYDYRRDRLQTIYHQVRMFPLFRQDEEFEDFDAVLSVSYEGDTSTFETLFVADILLRNQSNFDYPEFDFGVSLAANSKCVLIGREDPDQHHLINIMDTVTPFNPRSEIKFRLIPFNRQDAYSLRLYIVPEARGSEDPVVKSFTSSHAIRFVEDPGFNSKAYKWMHSYSIWLAVAAFVLGVLANQVHQYVSASLSLDKSVRSQREIINLQLKMLQDAETCVKRKGDFDWASLVCIEKGEVANSD